mmetsp:Transcript_14349/g.54104  ORF Transcript_14349/g.54104 Transcript_14349/m.54104 type:complete len:251 (+) Transcript_14349:2755-3507(+)|eukprot:scaffold279_cov229-Pinguiococcus_pyrenoidosus.AAC.2
MLMGLGGDAEDSGVGVLPAGFTLGRLAPELDAPNGTFPSVYQPQVRDGRLVSSETMSARTHPMRCRSSSEGFLPSAVKTSPSATKPGGGTGRQNAPPFSSACLLLRPVFGALLPAEPLSYFRSMMNVTGGVQNGPSRCAAAHTKTGGGQPRPWSTSPKKPIPWATRGRQTFTVLQLTLSSGLASSKLDADASLTTAFCWSKDCWKTPSELASTFDGPFLGLRHTKGRDAISWKSSQGATARPVKGLARKR